VERKVEQGKEDLCGSVERANRAVKKMREIEAGLQVLVKNVPTIVKWCELKRRKAEGLQVGKY